MLFRFLTNMMVALPHACGGRIRSLAVSSAKRSPVVPDMPTIHELGVTDFDEGGQHGIIAPANLPRDILGKLHGSIVTAMRSPEVSKLFTDDGSTVVASTPDEFRALMRRETAKWTQIVKTAGIAVQ